jgi:hypothetical protein
MRALMADVVGMTGGQGDTKKNVQHSTLNVQVKTGSAGVVVAAVLPHSLFP